MTGLPEHRPAHSRHAWIDILCTDVFRAETGRHPGPAHPSRTDTFRCHFPSHGKGSGQVPGPPPGQGSPNAPGEPTRRRRRRCCPTAAANSAEAVTWPVRVAASWGWRLRSRRRSSTCWSGSSPRRLGCFRGHYRAVSDRRAATAGTQLRRVVPRPRRCRRFLRCCRGHRAGRDRVFRGVADQYAHHCSWLTRSPEVVTQAETRPADRSAAREVAGSGASSPPSSPRRQVSSRGAGQRRHQHGPRGHREHSPGAAADLAGDVLPAA